MASIELRVEVVAQHPTHLGDIALNVSSAMTEDVIQPDCVADDLGREPMARIGAGWAVIPSASLDSGPGTSRLNLAMPYREMLARMAGESGIETPTAEDLIRLDRNRNGKTLSNAGWESRTDPDARIAKLTDTRD